MNGFIHNLVNRHSGTNNFVKPRIRGKYEPVAFTPLTPELGRDHETESSNYRDSTDMLGETSLKTGNTFERGLISETINKKNVFEGAGPAGTREIPLIHNNGDINFNASKHRPNEPSGNSPELKNKIAWDKSVQYNEHQTIVNQPPGFTHKKLENENSKANKSNEDTVDTNGHDGEKSNQASDKEYIGEAKEFIDRKMLEGIKRIMRDFPGETSWMKGTKEKEASFENKLPNTVRNEARGTIKITIGRIEVRAVSEPVLPKVKAQERARPAMSLDDYLNKRNKGS